MIGAAVSHRTKDAVVKQKREFASPKEYPLFSRINRPHFDSTAGKRGFDFLLETWVGMNYFCLTWDSRSWERGLQAHRRREETIRAHGGRTQSARDLNESGKRGRQSSGHPEGVELYREL
jgi:hypothetical protein